MTKSISSFANSLRQIGEIQVAEWDFMGLLNTEIRELEISRSLRRWGAIRVMDWDFATVMPVIRETANKEVHLAEVFRRASRIQVMEWSFMPTARPATSSRPEVAEVIRRLRNFLQFVVVNLIDEPKDARITVKEMGGDVLRFKLVMVKRDVAMLIGREGHTAGAIRRILQATGQKFGTRVLLHILSHEDDNRLAEADPVSG